MALPKIPCAENTASCLYHSRLQKHLLAERSQHCFSMCFGLCSIFFHWLLGWSEAILGIKKVKNPGIWDISGVQSGHSDALLPKPSPAVAAKEAPAPAEPADVTGPAVDLAPDLEDMNMARFFQQVLDKVSNKKRKQHNFIVLWCCELVIFTQLSNRSSEIITSAVKSNNLTLNLVTNPPAKFLRKKKKNKLYIEIYHELPPQRETSHEKSNDSNAWQDRKSCRTFETEELEILDEALSSAKRCKRVCKLTILCVQRHINVTCEEIVPIIVRAQAFNQLLAGTWSFTNRHLCFRSHQGCPRITQSFSSVPHQLIPPSSSCSWRQRSSIHTRGTHETSQRSE